MNLLDILSKYFQTGKTNGFSTEDYIHAYGRSSHALLYADLYCPDLVELNGSILLKHSVSYEGAAERFREKQADKNVLPSKLESSFNFIEVPYLFGSSGRDTSDEEDFFLANKLADSWRAWLSYQFKGRNFIVQVLSPEQTGSVVGITFFEIRG